MSLRLLPALALLVPLAAAEESPPASGGTTTTTTTTTTTLPASAPPKGEHHEHEEEAAEASAKTLPPGVRMSVMDIRASFGVQEGPSHVHDEYVSGNGSMLSTGGRVYDLDRGSSAGGIFEVQFDMGTIHDWGGLLWGAGLRGVGHNLDLKNTPNIPQTQNLSYGTFGPLGHIDYAYAINPIWHLEVGPFISFGGASLEWFDQDTGGVYRKRTANGGYFQEGLRAGSYVALAHHFVIGGELEYSGTWARMNVNYDVTGGHSRITIHDHGFGGLVTAGYRF
jgi:hypothetical protein